ncbi:Cof-type HAD-IIB family hydrolase [Lentibacillus salinarum]|uniref:Cof-type HAD-IIB family hydrolase n=1 Tax=Lentibacillus salinarum TaxID=446820 RepID=A0ABW3ZWL0_9BACI
MAQKIVSQSYWKPILLKDEHPKGGGSTIAGYENILLVSDLDGTLLDSEQQISEENQRAITEFKKSGGIFTIATGRMEQAALPFAELLKIDVPIILYNGAVLYHPKSHSRIAEKSLDGYGELLEAFQTIMEETELGLLIYQNGGVYTTQKNETIRQHEEKDQVECQLITNPAVLKGPITKILLISSDRKTLAKCEEIVKLRGYPCGLVYSEHNYLEILPEGASKGSALLHLQDYLNHDFTTVCVGDNLNDLPMLEEAARGFIVGNCHSSLTDYKFNQTVHHEEHAIADIIYNHIFQ